LLTANRVAVMIDEGYFEKIKLICLGNTRIDYLKLSDALCEGKNRYKTYVYYALPFLGKNPSPAQQELYDGKRGYMDKLKHLPDFEVRLGHIAAGPGRKAPFQQEGVDQMFISDLRKLSSEGLVDSVVIIAGDSHFAPAVASAKEKGIHITLYHKDCYDGPQLPKNNRSGLSSELERLCHSVKVIEKDLVNSVLL